MPLRCGLSAVSAKSLLGDVLQSEPILFRLLVGVRLFSRLQLPFQLNCFTVHRQPMTPAFQDIITRCAGLRIPIAVVRNGVLYLGQHICMA